MIQDARSHEIEACKIFKDLPVPRYIRG
jgi:hypothetical protein